jgi:lysophospholipase L1-like esterase
VLAACLALEIGLRLFSPVGLPPTDTFLAVWKIDDAPEAGRIALVPGVVTRYRTPEFDVAVRINSRGLREREIGYDRPPGVFRILVLGDSQTFGWGVEADETYPRLVEHRLAAARRRPVQVINAAVPGTGTAHQLYFLQTEGWKYRPDLVILGFFPFNDITDNGQCRLFEMRNGRLTLVGQPSTEAEPFPEGTIRRPAGDRVPRVIYAPSSPEPPRPSFWVRHSHLVRFVRARLARLGRLARPPQPGPVPRNRGEAKELTTYLLDELYRQCRAHSAACLVVLIPAGFDCANPELPSLASHYAPLLRFLTPSAGVLDLTAPFRAAGCVRLFFRKDSHLTPAGHRVTAEAIARRLLASSSSPSPPP